MAKEESICIKRSIKLNFPEKKDLDLNFDLQMSKFARWHSAECTILNSMACHWHNFTKIPFFSSFMHACCSAKQCLLVICVIYFVIFYSVLFHFISVF